MGAHQHKMRTVIAGLAHQQRVEAAADKEGKPGSDGTAAADSGASGLSVAKWILGEEAAAAREAAAKDAAAKQAEVSRERKETEKVLRAQAEVEQAHEGLLASFVLCVGHIEPVKARELYLKFTSMTPEALTLYNISKIHCTATKVETVTHYPNPPGAEKGPPSKSACHQGSDSSGTAVQAPD